MGHGVRKVVSVQHQIFNNQNIHAYIRNIHTYDSKNQNCYLFIRLKKTIKKKSCNLDATNKEPNVYCF